MTFRPGIFSTRRLGRAGSGPMSIVFSLAVAMAVAGAATGIQTAEAAPSVWAKVRDPDLGRRHNLAVKVDRLLANYQKQMFLDSMGRTLNTAPVFLQEARRLLDEGAAAETTDIRLRFQLAEVLQEFREIKKAAGILESILRTNPPAPYREEALRALAICYARLGRHDEEIKAYDQSLALQPHNLSRALLLANRGEAYMALGRLTEAIESYELALRAVSTNPFDMIKSGVTTLWGLAVASDRNGDLETAMQAIALARSYDPKDVRIHSSNWFYVPAYDEFWYAALGHWMAARRAELNAVRMEEYRQAILSWNKYIEEAPETDHWVGIAKARLRMCEKEQEAAMKRAIQKFTAK